MYIISVGKDPLPEFATMDVESAPDAPVTPDELADAKNYEWIVSVHPRDKVVNVRYDQRDNVAAFCCGRKRAKPLGRFLKKSPVKFLFGFGMFVSLELGLIGWLSSEPIFSLLSLFGLIPASCLISMYNAKLVRFVLRETETWFMLALLIIFDAAAASMFVGTFNGGTRILTLLPLNAVAFCVIFLDARYRSRTNAMVARALRALTIFCCLGIMVTCLVFIYLPTSNSRGGLKANIRNIPIFDSRIDFTNIEIAAGCLEALLFFVVKNFVSFVREPQGFVTIKARVTSTQDPPYDAKEWKTYKTKKRMSLKPKKPNAAVVAASAGVE